MQRDDILALAARVEKINPSPFDPYATAESDVSACAAAVEELRDIIAASLRAIAEGTGNVHK